MRRHRFFNLYLDTMRNVLRVPGATPEFIKTESERIKEWLAIEFGSEGIDQKFERYMELSPPEFCAIFDYHLHSRQIANAYVSGHDFPALTGACCLGERIFNLIIHELRDLHKSSPVYKKVRDVGSFQNWELAIEILREWALAPEPVLKRFADLKEIRHRAVHYGEISELQTQARRAVQLALEITDGLFGMRDDVFFWAPGEPYIRKERQSDPFVKRFLVPACPLVGYKHWLTTDEQLKWTFHDLADYEAREVDDAEFVRLRNEWNARRAPTDAAPTPKGL